MLRWLAMLLGPIFAKEMVEMARRKRYYFNRSAYGVTLLLVMFAIWEENRWRIESAGPGIIRVQAQMAEQLYYGVIGVQYGAVVLFVPLFLAGVIATEREEKTLDLLLTTQLHDRDIVLGKLFSRIAVLILIMFSGLPVLSLVMLMGGISPLGLALVTVATLLMIFFCGAHAIYFSTITKSPIGALVRTYWWLAVWLLGVPMVAVLVLETILSLVPWPLDQQIAAGAACVGMIVNPIGPFVVAVVPEMYDEAAKILGNWFFPFTLIVPTMWASMLIWLAVCRLRGDVTPFVLRLQRWIGFARSRDRLRSLRERWLAALQKETAGWADDPLLRPIGNSIVGEANNPFQQRARRARVYDREWIIGRIQWGGWAAAIGFFLLIAACKERELRQDGVSVTFQGLTWFGIALLTAILAGTSLVGDRRRGFLEQVLVTPLTGQEVIDGTLLAIWEHMRRVALLPVVLGVLFCATGASTVIGTMCSFTTAALSCALLALCGVGCSLPAKTFSSAMTATFTFPILFIIVPPIYSIEFGSDHAVLLWGSAILLLLLTLLWVRQRVNAALVCLYVLATHLALSCAATCWTYDGMDESFPAAAMNPALWTGILLEDSLAHIWPASAGPWGLAMVLYWLSLAGSFVWVRWWLIRNFDRLAGRAEQPEATPVDQGIRAEERAVPVGAGVDS
jgi:ABC-type transport system involved in multi-copper enzyme maturation permease subunit